MRLLQELDWLTEPDVVARAQAAMGRPASLERDTELAILFIALGRFDQASDYAESAFNAQPDEPYGAYACGVVRVQQGDWERALAALQKIPADFERAGEVGALCAVSLYELGRAGEADRLAQTFVSVDDETHGTLCALRGRCAVALGDQAAAAAFFDEALQYAPKLEWVRKVRATLPRAASAADVAAVVI
jgi:tetratricopeptide (TPR) repeat protein